MPISPEYLSYHLDMLKTHKELQESILRDIARRLLKTDFTVTDTAAWQAEKLQQAGMLFDDITYQVAMATPKTQDEIKKLFRGAEVEIFDYDDELLISVGQNPGTFKTLSPAMKQIMDAALQKTSTEAVNLTKTTAVTSQNLYLSACDLAHMQVTSGAFTYQQAIVSAIKSASSQGINVLYPTGHKSSLDVAIRRSALTGVNQTCGQLQLMRANDMDIDIMEITAHSGARPSHASWQGQLVSLSGQDGYLTLSDIGHGDVTGFMGANCRHNWHMFWDGLSVRAYTPQMLDEYKNSVVTYDGREYPEYDAKQIMRGIERSVRQTKQELVMLDESIKQGEDLKTDFAASSVKLKRQEAKLKDFCNQTGFRPDTFRTQVFATETKGGKTANFGKSVSQKAVWAKKKETLTNAAGHSIIKVNRTTVEGIPNSITQKTNKKGGIDRNYYNSDGKQTKQISDNDHGHKKEREFGKHGEHAHDYYDGADGRRTHGKPRELTPDERKENSDIL